MALQELESKTGKKSLSDLSVNKMIAESKKRYFPRITEL